MIEVPDWVPKWNPLPVDAHKGDAGRVVIVGGSPGLTGAVVLAATAALRGGAGLVIAAVPRALRALVESSRAETMTTPLDDDRGVATGLTAEARDLVERSDAVILGPGLGRDPRSVDLCASLLEIDVPCVVDADGLFGLAQRPDLLEPEAARSRKSARVLTPHRGELRRLLAATGTQNAEELADKTGSVVVEKSSRTRVHGPSGSTPPCQAGNPALATGGSGDVLAGLIGALVPRAKEVESAARLGVWVHARAADYAAYGARRAGSQVGPPEAAEERAGEPGTLPSDLCEHFVYAFAEIATAQADENA